MRRPVVLIVTALAVSSCLAVIWHYKIEFTETGIQLRARPTAMSGDGGASGGKAAKITRPAGTVRFASFQVDPLTGTELHGSDRLNRLAEIMGRFDLVALQGIHEEGPKPLVYLTDEIKRKTGREFDAVIGPLVGRKDRRQRFAVIYDTAQIEVGRLDTYTIPERGDPFLFDPLVVSVRTRGEKPDQAFTCSVVVLYVSDQDAARELQRVSELIRRVQMDGRREDDVLLMGTFQSDGEQIGAATHSARLAPLIRGEDPLLKTLTDRSEQADNVVIDTWATTEFTGRLGVFDFMREFNLDLESASSVASHLPVWVEFHIRETEAGPMAKREAASRTVR